MRHVFRFTLVLALTLTVLAASSPAFAQDCAADQPICVRFHEVTYDTGAAIPRDALDRPIVVPGARLRIKLQVDFKNPGSETAYPGATVVFDTGLYGLGSGSPLYDTQAWSQDCVTEPLVTGAQRNTDWNSRCTFTARNGAFVARGNNGVDAQLFELIVVTQNWRPPDGHVFTTTGSASATGYPTPPSDSTSIVFDGFANPEARHLSTSFNGEVVRDLDDDPLSGPRKYKSYNLSARVWNTITNDNPTTCASSALLAGSTFADLGLSDLMIAIGMVDEATRRHYPLPPSGPTNTEWDLDLDASAFGVKGGNVFGTLDGPASTDLGVSSRQLAWNSADGGRGCASNFVRLEVLIECADIADGLYIATPPPNDPDLCQPTSPNFDPRRCYIQQNTAPYSARGWRFDQVPPAAGGTASPVTWSAGADISVIEDGATTTENLTRSRTYWPYELLRPLVSVSGNPLGSCRPQTTAGSSKATSRLRVQGHVLNTPHVSNGDPYWRVFVVPPGGVFRAERFTVVDHLAPWSTFTFTAQYPRILSGFDHDVDADLYLCRFPRTFVPATPPAVAPADPEAAPYFGAPLAHHYDPDAEVVIGGVPYRLDPDDFDPAAAPWLWSAATQTGCYLTTRGAPQVNVQQQAFAQYTLPGARPFEPAEATHFVLHNAVWENVADPNGQIRQFVFDYTADVPEFPGALTPTDDLVADNGTQVEVFWTRNIARLGGGLFDSDDDGDIDGDDRTLSSYQCVVNAQTGACEWSLIGDQHFDNRVRVAAQTRSGGTTVSYGQELSSPPAFASCGVNTDAYLGRPLEGLELTLRLHPGFEPTPLTGAVATALHEANTAVIQSDATSTTRRVDTMPSELAVTVNQCRPSGVVMTADDLRTATVWPPELAPDFDPTKSYVHKELVADRWTYRLRLPQGSGVRWCIGTSVHLLTATYKPKAGYPFIEQTNYNHTCEARAYNARAPESPETPYSRVSSRDVPIQVVVTGSLALGREPACDATTSRPAFEFPILNTGGVNEQEVIATVTLPSATSPAVPGGPTRPIALRAMTLLANPSTSAPALELALASAPTTWIPYSPTAAWQGQAVHAARVRYPANSQFPAYSEGRFRLDFDVPGVALADLGATISAGATIDSQRILPADALPGSPAILGECPAYLTVEKRFDAADGPWLDQWPITAALTQSQLASAPENPGDTAMTAGGRVTFPVYPSQVVTLTETLPSNTSGPRWTAISTPTGFQMGFANETRMFINTCACDDGYTCAAADVCRLVDPTAPVADQAVCDYGAPLGAEPSATPIGCDPDDVTALVTDADGDVVGAIRCRVLAGAMTCDTNPDGTLTVHTDRLECN